MGTSLLDGYDFSRGAFLPPTIIEDIEPDDVLWKEEVFGPVIVVKRFFVRRVSPTYLNPNLSDFLRPRRSRKACNSPMTASTGSAQVFGLATCPEHTGSPLRSMLDFAGSTAIIAMIPVPLGNYRITK